VSLQIAKLILYRRGEIRELPFRTGALNILTGASKTGKSAIIDIVDYCTGRSECNVADGVIRKYVGWYALLFQLGKGQIFIARRNPELGERTSPDIYMDRGSAIEPPPETSLFKNTTVSAVEKFLGAAIGISENEHRPSRSATPSKRTSGTPFCLHSKIRTTSTAKCASFIVKARTSSVKPLKTHFPTFWAP
jgi:hypothetical protein